MIYDNSHTSACFHIFLFRNFTFSIFNFFPFRRRHGKEFVNGSLNKTLKATHILHWVNERNVRNLLFFGNVAFSFNTVIPLLCLLLLLDKLHTTFMCLLCVCLLPTRTARDGDLTWMCHKKSTFFIIDTCEEC